MNNYKLNVSMGVKEMYLNLNKQVQEMDNKFKELYNNPAYTSAYKSQQFLIDNTNNSTKNKN